MITGTVPHSLYIFWLKSFSQKSSSDFWNLMHIGTYTFMKISIKFKSASSLARGVARKSCSRSFRILDWDWVAWGSWGNRAIVMQRIVRVISRLRGSDSFIHGKKRHKLPIFLFCYLFVLFCTPVHVLQHVFALSWTVNRSRSTIPAQWEVVKVADHSPNTILKRSIHRKFKISHLHYVRRS